MNNRYLGALMLLPLVALLFVGGDILKYGVLILSLLGMREFYKVLKFKNINSLGFIGYIFCVIYYLYMGKQVNFQLLTMLIILGTLILLIVPLFIPYYNFLDCGATLLGFVYVAVFFSLIPVIFFKEQGRYLIWLIFLSSWLCDTSAYYVGRCFGKHKISPKTSPNKTIEGSIGGLIGSTAACLIFGSIIQRYGVNIALYHFAAIGFICGILCQCGDLVASSIKRYAGVKDFSHLIPGHGGILDRFDSILFASVVVYYYITMILGM